MANKSAILDPLRNPKDPLHKSGPEAGKELFRHFSQLMDGFPHEAGINAAMNILINSLRQIHPTRAGAEKRFDEIMGRYKGILLDQNYDAFTGKRRNVFPHNQVVSVPHFDLRSKN